jgi:hypothetical protein
MARRSPAGKLNQIRKVTRAWEDLAPDSVFYGFTLEQFKSVVQPSEATRAEIADLQRRLREAINRRNAADAKSMRVLKFVVNAVKGHQRHGNDSTLYAAMGYVQAAAQKITVGRFNR